MTAPPTRGSAKNAGRIEREAAALRENLRKRKERERLRAEIRKGQETGAESSSGKSKPA